MPPALRVPLNIAEYLPASGCMTADPSPPTTMQSASPAIECTIPLSETPAIVSAIAAGMNHQRPCRSE